MAHKSGSNKALKIVVEEVSKDGYRTIIFDRQPIKWIEILTEWGEILFEGKNSIPYESPILGQPISVLGNLDPYSGTWT